MQDKTYNPPQNLNLQDFFLNYLRKNKIIVVIFLVNGVKLQGIIPWFDKFAILLRHHSQVQLIYKHAISTITSTKPIQLFDLYDDVEQSPAEDKP